MRVVAINHQTKVNYIKFSGSGVQVRVGLFYQFWIGGYWLQEDGSHGKVLFYVGRLLEFVLLLQHIGIFIIKIAKEKGFQKLLQHGRWGIPKSFRKSSNFYIFQTNVYCSLPLRLMSRWFGWIAERQVPETLRPVVYGLYSSAFGVNIDEALVSDFK